MRYPVDRKAQTVLTDAMRLWAFPAEFRRGVFVNYTLTTTLGAPPANIPKWMSLPDHIVLVVVSAMAIVGLIMLAWRLRVWRTHRAKKKALYHWHS